MINFLQIEIIFKLEGFSPKNALKHKSRKYFYFTFFTISAILAALICYSLIYQMMNHLNYPYQHLVNT